MSTVANRTSSLNAAKAAKNDEFCAQWADKQNEMDADHVPAWSKGGATDLTNLRMLCVPHNRAKGNR